MSISHGSDHILFTRQLHTLVLWRINSSKNRAQIPPSLHRRQRSDQHRRISCSTSSRIPRLQEENELSLLFSCRSLRAEETRSISQSIGHRQRSALRHSYRSLRDEGERRVTTFRRLAIPNRLRLPSRVSFGESPSIRRTTLREERRRLCTSSLWSE